MILQQSSEKQKPILFYNMLYMDSSLTLSFIWITNGLSINSPNHLPLTAVDLNPARGFGQCHARKLWCGSTKVPACAWNNAQRGTWGLPPPGKLESRHIAITELVRNKTHHPHKIKQWYMCLCKLLSVG